MRIKLFGFTKNKGGESNCLDLQKTRVENQKTRMDNQHLKSKKPKGKGKVKKKRVGRARGRRRISKQNGRARGRRRKCKKNGRARGRMNPQKKTLGNSTLTFFFFFDICVNVPDKIGFALAFDKMLRVKPFKTQIWILTGILIPPPSLFWKFTIFSNLAYILA